MIRDDFEETENDLEEEQGQRRGISIIYVHSNFHRLRNDAYMRVYAIGKKF